ncbi:hypothetical protein GCM10010174_09330 [Kutzneria viridogrisea]|uniref:Uncharacterized protein n=1 Tax=Kutzneria viridogrisea TaxID=47990 RepID=A0ABR6BX13_9PSEU|nr:hypothetical protein [Kutzneria viridogrisea]
MTFPTGGPAPAPAKSGQELDKLLYLATAGLGVLILFLGFLPLTSSTTQLPGGAAITASATFFTGAGWIQAGHLIAGLLAALVALPGKDVPKPGPFPGLVAVGTVLPFLFTVFSASGVGFGGIIVLILGVVQAGAAVAAFLFGAGILKPPAPRPQPQPGAWSPQTGGFPQPQQGQPGQFGQPQFGQPQQGQPQPGQYGQQPVQPQGQPYGQPQQAPQPQPTQFMSQPGQFSQPMPPGQAPQPGQYGQQQPGTPPGGFGAPPQG